MSSRPQLRLGHDIKAQGAYPYWQQTKALATSVWDGLQDDTSGAISLFLGIDPHFKRSLVLSHQQARTLRSVRISSPSSAIAFKSLSPLRLTSKKALEKALNNTGQASEAECQFEMLRLLSHVSYDPAARQIYGLQSADSPSTHVVTLCLRHWDLDGVKKRLGFQFTVGTLGNETHTTYSFQNQALAALGSRDSEPCHLRYESEKAGIAKLKTVLHAEPNILVVLSRDEAIDEFLNEVGVTDFSSVAAVSNFHRQSPPPSGTREYRSFSSRGSYHGSRDSRDHESRRTRSPSRRHDWRPRESQSYRPRSRSRSPRRSPSGSPRRRSRTRSPTRRSSPSSPRKQTSAPLQRVLVQFGELYRSAIGILSHQPPALRPRCPHHHSDELFHAFSELLSGPSSFEMRIVNTPASALPASRVPCAPVATDDAAAAPNPPSVDNLAEEDEEALEPVDPRAVQHVASSASSSRVHNAYDSDSSDDDGMYVHTFSAGPYSANHLENEARKQF